VWDASFAEFPAKFLALFGGKPMAFVESPPPFTAFLGWQTTKGFEPFC
jgi:hypothetical protein